MKGIVVILYSLVGYGIKSVLGFVAGVVEI